MKKLCFVFFIVITLVTYVTVYGQEKQYQSKEEIRVTITQMKDLLSALDDENLYDEKTQKLKHLIKNYIKEAKSCLENFSDGCHDRLSKKANNLVEVKFKDYRDHYNKTHKK